jgi:hypothetical protein
MKALEKDRTRRYETANGLAMDLQRHLSNEPVVARPAGATYRVQKLVRRNKLAFAAGTAIFALVWVPGAYFLARMGTAILDSPGTSRTGYPAIPLADSARSKR